MVTTMKVISFNATKGGTGKTTLSIITLNALTADGFKCLAIDTDMINHSLSFYYNTGIDFDTIQSKNIFKVFIGESIKENTIKIKSACLLGAHAVQSPTVSNSRQLDATVITEHGYLSYLLSQL